MKMALSQAKLLGAAETVWKTMDEEQAAMIASGSEPQTMKRNLMKVHDDLVTEEAHQEDLKRQLRESTDKIEVLRKKLYNLTSGGVDALLTAVERSSPAGKIIRRLRSRLSRPDTQAPPAIQPVPERIG